MPTYQYACTDCDHRFEQVQSFTDASLTTCPVCSGQLRKVYGSVGVVFKGSGFYRTDSREKVKSGSATNGSGDKSADTGGKAESGTEKSGAEKSGTEKSGTEKSADKKSESPAKAATGAPSSTGGSSGGGSSRGSKAAAS